MCWNSELLIKQAINVGKSLFSHIRTTYLKLIRMQFFNSMKIKKLQSNDWRQSLAALLCMLQCFLVFLSICFIGLYLIKDKPVYEELVDYLDKTIAISKINYNQQLGFFELSENELEGLEQHRTVFHLISSLLVWYIHIRNWRKTSSFCWEMNEILSPLSAIIIWHDNLKNLLFIMH